MTITQTTTLHSRLQDSPGTPSRLASVVEAIADATIALGRLVAAPPLTADEDAIRNAGGDIQQPLDLAAHDLVIESLSDAPVQWVLSEEADEAVQIDSQAPYAVAIDPLDGSSNIAVNGPVGTIFAVMAVAPDSDTATAFASGGRTIAAAGFVLFGPATVLVISTGDGTDVYHLDGEADRYVLTEASVTIPPVASEFAINASNQRHWEPWLRRFIEDLLAGETGPNGADFNMRWIAALIAECFRILVRGGIFLYPADVREGYRQGRLRLLYEAYPIAYLVEQAGGCAIDGEIRILDKAAVELHERTPLIFGSRDTVATIPVERAERDLHTGERSPLFAKRGLFRS